MTLGDRMVVLDRGRIQQVDAPGVVYERPANTFVAGFVGTPPMNLLGAEVADGALRVGDQSLDMPPWVHARVGRSGRVVGAPRTCSQFRWLVRLPKMLSEAWQMGL